MSADDTTFNIILWKFYTYKNSEGYSNKLKGKFFARFSLSFVIIASTLYHCSEFHEDADFIFLLIIFEILQPDRSYDIVLKSATTTYLLLQAAGIQRGARRPGMYNFSVKI